MSAVFDPVPDEAGITRPMTYDEYLASPEEMRRYDIVGGIKCYRMYGAEGRQRANPTRLHLRMQWHLCEAFTSFEVKSAAGEVLPPPCDVFITEFPQLRMRQPDLFFISNERLAENAPPDVVAPLRPAPELVVEIISPSDRPSVLAAKIADYRSADVREIWLIRSGIRTVEVWALSWDEILLVATYGAGETVTSVVFPGLTAEIDAIFAD